MGLLDALDWITLNAQTGGVYVIVLGSDQGISNVVLDCGGKQVTVSLKTPGPERKVTFASRTPSYALFTVKAGVTFTLEDKVTLAGLQSGSRSLVNVEGGRFIMNGGTIKDNKVDGYELSGGGVFITSGGFTMNGGAISGNTVSNGYGGGVYVDAGTFTMNAGTISGNTARGNAYSGGGGVYVSYGTFTMSGGTISGNTTSSPVAGGGGGVYVSKGTFTMSGGAVSNNTAYGGGGVCVSGGGFTMSGGTISGNTARGSGAGGGVYVSGARFTMSGGTISGNTARGSGGGVCVNYNGTFTKSGSGGVIYGSDAAEEANRASKSGHAVYTSNGSRDTTARITRSLDSTKRGPEGGWE
jgi:hypothetical protein